MEVALVAPDSLRIKGKNATLVVDPSLLKTKISSDIIVLLNNKTYDASKIEGQRLIIEASGEYEVSGVKISADKINNDLLYNLRVDGLNVLLGKMETIEKHKEKLDGHDVMIVYIVDSVDKSVVVSIAPRVAIFYGEKAESLSKEVAKVTKFSTSLEKLPQEIETVVLG